MKIVPQSATLLSITPDALLLIERCGRVCYKSEEKMECPSCKGTGKTLPGGYPCKACNERAAEFVKKIIKSGHESVIEHASATFLLITDRGMCYDDKTQVLTKKGWMFFKDVTDELIATKNEEGELVYIEPIKKVVKEYKGVLHHWSSTQVDLMVTPNHNMWVFDYEKRSDDQNVWKFIKSEDANNSRYKFEKGLSVVSRDNDNDDYKFYIPSKTISRGFYEKEYEGIFFDVVYFAEFLGWWVTDGCVSLTKNGAGGRILISQSKKNGRERISFLLGRLGLNYSEHKEQFRISCVPLMYWLYDNFIPKDTTKTHGLKIPRFVFDMPVIALDAFLKGVIGGDGSPISQGSGYQVYTASEEFAKDLSELALMTGYASNIREQEERKRYWPDGRVSDCKKQYVVQIHKTIIHLFDKRTAKKEEVDYDGVVYCVELPVHHRLFVMRNGKSVWCGNTHEIVRHRLAAYSQESTRYCNYGNKGGEITIVSPDLSAAKEPADKGFEQAMMCAEHSYLALIAGGVAPQHARSVLPTCLKTEIAMTANFREWRHILKLRATNKRAHPQIRQLMRLVLEELQRQVSSVFEDIMWEE